MANLTKGLKSGTIAGLAYGVVNAILAYIILIELRSSIIAALNKYLSQHSNLISISAQNLYDLALITTPVAEVIVGIILGLIFGALFGIMYNKIPFSSPVGKGLLFSFFIWLILNVGIEAANIGTYGFTYYIVSAGLSLIGAVVYGLLLGYLYGRGT